MGNVVKNTTRISLFDLVSPHFCRGCGVLGSPLCERCKKYISANHTNLCPHCKAPCLSGLCSTCHAVYLFFSAGQYSGLLGELIHDFKYNSNRSLAKSLAGMLDMAIPNLKGRVVVVPLPTVAKHVRARGVDHTLRLAQELVRIRGKNYRVERALVRRKNGVQVGASRKVRLIQAMEAYSVNPKFVLDVQATYLLLDDVYTTGASMRAATIALEGMGVGRIIQAVIAMGDN